MPQHAEASSTRQIRCGFVSFCPPHTEDDNRSHCRSTQGHKVREFLENSFSATAAGDLATDIELRFPEHSLFCDIRNNQLSFPDITAADLVLYFQSPEQACGLLSGTQDPIAAFMESRLRANGHLIRVFQFFAAFALPQTPEQ